MARRPRVAIVGFGLVGGSLARTLTAARYHVTGIDWPLVVRRALRSRAIAAGATRAEAAATADLVVLAAPPATNLRLLRRLARVARPGLVITDVSSVKGEDPSARRRAWDCAASWGGTRWRARRSAASPRPRREPLRGALVGYRARARGARDAPRARGGACDAARPITTDAPTHDRAMAFLSHAPQVVAWALLEAAREDAVAGRHLRRAGPGFRGMTRLARSPRPLWRDILDANRTEVRRALAALVRRLVLPPRRR